MRRNLPAAVAACVLLAVPASASAATERWAAPTADDSGDCLTAATACTFGKANSMSASGDTIHLKGGAYSFTSTVTPAQKVTIVGEPGARPLLQVTNPGGFGFDLVDVTLRHVDLSVTDTSSSTGVSLYRSVLEDATVTAGGAVTPAVQMASGSTLRNTLVRGADDSSTTTAVSALGSVTIEHATLRGYVALFAPNDDFTASTVDVRNTILQGAHSDLQYRGKGTDNILNLVRVRVATYLPNGDAEPAPGARTGLVTEPALLDAAGHQQAGSPTIDKGASAAENDRDFDGDPRWLDVAPDIGADEFPGAPFVGTPHVTPGSVKATIDVPVNAAAQADIVLHWGIKTSGWQTFPQTVTQDDVGPGTDLWLPTEQATQPATTYVGYFTATDANGTMESSPFEFTTLPLPQTTLSGPATTQETRPTFTFSSTPAGATFTCAIDAGAPAACTSPWKVPSALALGSHTISVLATDQWGAVEEEPATRTFVIVAPATNTNTNTNTNTGTGSGDETPPQQQTPPLTTPITPPAEQVRTLAPLAGKAKLKKGKLRVAVTNPNRAAATVAGKLVRKGRTLATGKLLLGPNAKGTLVLKLTKAGRKAAKKAKKLRGTLTLSIGSATTTKTLR